MKWPGQSESSIVLYHSFCSSQTPSVAQKPSEGEWFAWTPNFVSLCTASPGTCRDSRWRCPNRWKDVHRLSDARVDSAENRRKQKVLELDRGANFCKESRHGEVRREWCLVSARLVFHGRWGPQALKKIVVKKPLNLPIRWMVRRACVRNAPQSRNNNVASHGHSISALVLRTTSGSIYFPLPILGTSSSLSSVCYRLLGRPPVVGQQNHPTGLLCKSFIPQRKPLQLHK